MPVLIIKKTLHQVWVIFSHKVGSAHRLDLKQDVDSDPDKCGRIFYTFRVELPMDYSTTAHLHCIGLSVI